MNNPQPHSKKDAMPSALDACLNRLEANSTNSLADLFAQEPNRATQWTFKAAGITLDLCRTPIHDNSLKSIVKYAQSQELESKIQQLLSGGELNTTERRAAHHTALRDIFDSPASGHQQMARHTFERVCELADQLGSGQWLGANGNPITDVINIGIGGSDLGPRLVCAALDHGQLANSERPAVHFVANVDPVELDQVLATCQPSTTLIVVASKTFSTVETLENARAARQWLLREILDADLGKHLIGITANIEKAVEFGIDAENLLPLWDWVGGRYSLWSAIGLPIAIAHGSQYFEQLLRGANAMDKHFCDSELNQNLPFLLAALDLINVNVCGAQSAAVLPYSHQLALLPAYLQQLCMESNGKSVRLNGEHVSHATSPVVWGSAGTVGQHSFHQLLHQGTGNIPIDFILPLRPNKASTFDDDARHRQLVANCLAQSKALTEGKSAAQALQELLAAGAGQEEAERLAPHKASPGNRCNTIIAMDELTPATLGALIALYEHKIFVQSVFWDINAFDQWGVELGKQLGGPIDTAMSLGKKSSSETDAATQQWINNYFSANSR
ncbi:MAG: glucose-6-phosphate isomerase [Pseudomonadales bacterium]|nr:glucose-6-phosphate isomerase [Pseudomonadales bacterium]